MNNIGKQVADRINDLILRSGGDPDGGTCGDVWGVTGRGRRHEIVHGSNVRPLPDATVRGICQFIKEGGVATRMKRLAQVRDFLASGWQVVVLGTGSVESISNEGVVVIEDAECGWEAVLRGRLVYAVTEEPT